MPYSSRNSFVLCLSCSSTSSEKNKQDRLEQLRQNKRATEKERLSLRQSQTIVIPRSSLYGSEEEKEDIEEEKSCRSNNKLQLGSSISTKQTEQFYFRQKVALIATVFLISVGLIIMALALFWPSRILWIYSIQYEEEEKNWSRGWSQLHQSINGITKHWFSQ